MGEMAQISAGELEKRERKNNVAICPELPQSHNGTICSSFLEEGQNTLKMIS
jgi:hypothetical protein